METTIVNSPARKTAKRSSNACTRCRKQKIKCSGLQPCEGCRKRKATCYFDDKDDKVIVTRAYLLDLQRKIARSAQQTSIAEGSLQSIAPGHSVAESNPPAPSMSGHDDDAIFDEGHSQNSDDDQTAFSERQKSNPPSLTNPLAASPSTFMSASNGRPFYLGTSSNWSFAGRALQMTHEYLHQAPLPSSALLFDGLAYDLRSPAVPNSAALGSPAIPSPDYSIYLINAVKFHCGQMFHLFDDEEFHRKLQQYYSEPDDRTGKNSLWYIHFLLVLAFGKIFITQKSTAKQPSGAEFFLKAMEILPPAYVLCQDPIASTEILCCISLYLHCIDHRNAAHIYIGHAMRTALSYGMHTDMPVAQLGEEQVQRCRKIWWTVYVLDRQMTSLMGLPQSVQDGDIHCQLPVFEESNQRTTTLDMHIKLARIIAEINNNIYGVSGRFNRKFLNSTKASLETLAGVASELGQTLPLRLDNPGHGVSRISASLHLLYHQCIVLATRPLIFCYLKMKIESSEFLNNPTQPRFDNIIQMCIESAQQIIIILECLQVQGLLETFLFLDIDSLYVSSTILVIGPVLDEHQRDRANWVQRSTLLFESMALSGNLIADWRKSEMLKLDAMIRDILNRYTKGPSTSEALNLSETLRAAIHSTSIPGDQDAISLSPSNMIAIGTGDDISAEQILAIASSIQEEDIEWMDRAIAENGIW